MTMVSVTPENLPAAAAVYRESWQESHRSVCTRQFLASRGCAGYRRRGLEQGKQFYLLLDPEPVGVVSVAGREIGDLYVLPDRQGCGYGTRLLQFAMARTACPYLTVLSTNRRAIALYRRLGFMVCRRKQMLREGLWELELHFGEE